MTEALAEAVLRTKQLIAPLSESHLESVDRERNCLLMSYYARNRIVASSLSDEVGMAEDAGRMAAPLELPGETTGDAPSKADTDAAQMDDANGDAVDEERMEPARDEPAETAAATDAISNDQVKSDLSPTSKTEGDGAARTQVDPTVVAEGTSVAAEPVDNGFAADDAVIARDDWEQAGLIQSQMDELKAKLANAIATVERTESEKKEVASIAAREGESLRADLERTYRLHEEERVRAEAARDRDLADRDEAIASLETDNHLLVRATVATAEARLRSESIQARLQEELASVERRATSAEEMLVASRAAVKEGKTTIAALKKRKREIETQLKSALSNKKSRARGSKGGTLASLDNDNERSTESAERQDESGDHKKRSETIRECIYAGPKLSWNDIIGNGAAKRKLRILRMCLDPPDRELVSLYKKGGEKGVKGILLHGPPGTVSRLWLEINHLL